MSIFNPGSQKNEQRFTREIFFFFLVIICKESERASGESQYGAEEVFFTLLGFK